MMRQNSKVKTGWFRRPYKNCARDCTLKIHARMDERNLLGENFPISAAGTCRKRLKITQISTHISSYLSMYRFKKNYRNSTQEQRILVA